MAALRTLPFGVSVKAGTSALAPEDVMAPAWALSPNGELLAHTLPHRGVQVWRVATGERVAESRDPNPSELLDYCSVRFHPNGRWLLLGCETPVAVDVVDLAGNLLFTYNAPLLASHPMHGDLHYMKEPEIRCVDFCFDPEKGVSMAAGCFDCHTIEVFSLGYPHHVTNPSTGDDFILEGVDPFYTDLKYERALRPPTAEDDNWAAATEFAYSPDGELLATVDTNKAWGGRDSDSLLTTGVTLMLWRASDGKPVFSASAPVAKAEWTKKGVLPAHIAWSADSRVVAFTTEEHTWVLQKTLIFGGGGGGSMQGAFTDGLILNPPENDAFVWCDLSADGSSIATLTARGVLRVSSVTTEESPVMASFPGAKMVMFLRDPHRMALSFDDKIVIADV